MNKKDLWLRLKHYHFEHIVPTKFWDMVRQNFGGANASTKAFASKIAGKHGWEKQFAMKAIFEYKKFVYLGVISDFTVTPSKIIDVVWHEHLLFTEAYRDFCSTVIEHNFDHFPELIPNILQTKKFQQQYKQTLELYVAEFNIEAPESIWGNTKFDKKRMTQVSQNSGADASLAAYNGDSQPLHNYYDSETVNPSAFPEFSDSEGFDGGGASGGWGDSDSGSSDSGGDGDSGGCSGGCGGGCGGGD
jgi:hypothetical protein